MVANSDRLCRVAGVSPSASEDPLYRRMLGKSVETQTSFPNRAGFEALILSSLCCLCCSNAVSYRTVLRLLIIDENEYDDGRPLRLGWNLGRLLRFISGTRLGLVLQSLWEIGVANETGTNGKRSVGLGFGDLHLWLSALHRTMWLNMTIRCGMVKIVASVTLSYTSNEEPLNSVVVVSYPLIV
ncbi:hypothetical protein TNCV_103921 [Trichonephila clavipes]|nr:hypothetical protein TNCV_103921 [Trichonephila clavipes]